MSRLSLIDSAFLMMESNERLMHVASLLIFDLPTDYDGDFFQDLLSAYRKVNSFAPPFNQKLSYPRFKLEMPSWVDDPHFDLKYHIRHSALPRPGNQEQLFTLVSRLHSTMLDRHHPLWEFHIIEGLENNQFAIYFKVHHSCMDGLGRMAAIQRVLSESEHNRTVKAPWQAVSEPASSPEPKDIRAKSGILGQLSTIPEMLALLAKMKGYQFNPRNLASPLPFSAPSTLINVATSGQRLFATSVLSLSETRALGKALNATVNDVVMTVCAGALRRFLIERNSLPAETLIAFVPVSIRPKNSNAAGNQVSSILCKLGTDIADPLERLTRVVESSQEGKRRLSQLSREAAQNLTFILQTPAMTIQLMELSGRVKPAFNLIISNYPGPRNQLYLNGAAMKAIFPVSFLFGGQGLNITLTSYMDSLNIGLVACREVLPEVAQLADHITAAFDELKRAIPSKRSKAGQTKQTEPLS